MDRAVPSSPHVPPGTKWEDRWEILKPTIEFWYLEKRLSVPKLVKLMKENHNFDAVEHQYKHQFRKWGFKKNLTSKEKTQVERMVLARAGLGRTSFIEHNGRRVDPQKIRRHAKNMHRQDMVLKDPVVGAIGSVVAGAKLVFGKNVFLEWNMPFRVLKGSTPERHSIASPFTSGSPLTGGVVVKTPSDTASPSYSKQLSMKMASDVMKRVAIERGQWFMQGHREKLLHSLTSQETQVMSHWLYQFQMFAFTTAKYWGFGPRSWTASELGFDRPDAFEVGPSPEGLRYLTNSLVPDHGPSTPSQLCRWTIHTEPRDDLGPRYDNPWQPQWETPPIQQRLRDALEHTDFTKISSDDLPVTLSLIAKKAERSPNELLLESIGFAIMGRNVDLVIDLLDEATIGDVPIHTMFPLHLAINYLDGSEACCVIFNRVTEHIWRRSDHNTFKSVMTNERGYTCFDSLMIAIIKSHTSLSPSTLDDTKKDKRFPGEEMSICGRWDADSDCIRKLFSSGSSKIPFDWKHKFCHTSVQAVCHVLGNWRLWSVDPVSSGLFVKRCTNCGLKLELTHLHTLVFTTFLLAEAGCEDEDLFGMIACLLCFLSFLEDPRPKVHVSFALLFDCDSYEVMETCTHREVSPVEFADELRTHQTHDWSEKCGVGWALFRLILDRCSGKNGNEGDNNGDEAEEHDEDERYCFECESSTPLTRNRTLAMIWAAVQTELLTYRRLDPTDPWVSEYFDMADLLQSLQTDGNVSIGLIDRGLMQEPACSCGRFVSYEHARVEHATTTNFSNLEEDTDRVVYLID